MIKSRVVKLILSLDRPERLEFRKYLRTDFFNQSEVQRRIYTFILAALGPSPGPLTKMALYRHLFPDKIPALEVMETTDKKKVVGKRLDPELSELKSHLENYLIWKTSQIKGYQRDRLLLEALKHRSANALYLQYSGKAERDLDKSERYNAFYRFYKYDILVNRLTRPDFNRLTGMLDDLEEVIEQLDCFYVSQRMGHAYTRSGRQVLQKSGLDQDPMVQAIREKGMLEKFAGEFFVQIFTIALNGIQDQAYNREDFIQLEDTILSAIHLVPKEDQFAVFKILMNYSILYTLQITEDPENRKAYFDLLEYGLKTGYALQDGMLSSGMILNLARHACALQAHERGLALIERFQHVIPAPVREPTVRLARAVIAFDRGQFEQALGHLNAKGKATSDIDKLIERRLRICCYYELEEWHLLEYNLESGRKLVARMRKLGNLYREQFTEFIQVTRQLYNLRLARQHSSELTAELSQNPRGLWRWLAKKSQELELRFG